MEWDSDLNDSNSNSHNGDKRHLSLEEGVSLVSVDELTATYF